MDIPITEREQEAVKEHGGDLLRDLHANMRGYRDTERGVTALFFQVCGFIIAATGLLATRSDDAAFTALMFVLFGFFLVGFWWMVELRIAHDHRIYEELGKRTRQLWEAMGVARFGSDKYGSGGGWSRTLHFIRWTGSVVLLMLAIAIAAKLKPLLCSWSITQ